MTKLQEELEAKLNNMLANKEQLIAEMKQVRSSVLDDNPNQNKWLTKMINDIEKLDKYINQHQNRIDAIKQRQKLAENHIKRKQDTKRKILLGAMLEKWIEDEVLDKEKVAKGLDDFLVRPNDKDLFSEYF